MKAKKIFCIVAYDITDDRRRRRLVKVLEKYGVRVNFSVYECMFTQVQFLKIQTRLAHIVSADSDQVIYYPICVDCYTKIIYQPDKKREDKSVIIC